MTDEKKGSGMSKVFLIMSISTLISLFIFFLWGKIPQIKNTLHAMLDPTLGVLMNWNVLIGFSIIIFVLTFFTTLLQKYTTDQKAIAEIKKEQKDLQIEMKKYKDNPQKLMELQQSTLPSTMKMMQLTMKSQFYTIIPLVLLFRWFWDFFNVLGEYKFFGFLSWIWFYLIASIIFSTIIRNILKVA